MKYQIPVLICISWCLALQALSATAMFKDYDVKLASKLSRLNTTAESLMNSHADSALLYADSALFLSSNPLMALEYVKARRNIGQYYSVKGKFNESLSHYLEALRLAENYSLRSLESQLNEDIGIGYGNLGELEQALSHLSSAEKLLDQNDILSRAGLLNNMGIIRLKQGHYQKGIDHFLQCLDTQAWMGIPAKRATLWANIGWAYYLMGSYDKSLGYQRRALSQYKKLENKINLATVYNEIGATYTQLEDYAKAAEALYASEALCLAENYQLQLIDTYLNLNELFESKNDFKNALRYYKQYSVLKDSVFAFDTKKQVYELQTKYEVAKTQQENAVLTLDAMEKKKEVQDMKTTLVVSVIGTLMLVCLVVVLVIHRVQKKRALAIVREQKVEIEEKAKALEKANDKIKKINRNLESMVDYRTKKIIEQNEALKLYAFTSNHKVRAPLANLLGMADLFKNSVLAEDEIKEFGDGIYSEAKKLDKVLSEINSQTKG